MWFAKAMGVPMCVWWQCFYWSLVSWVVNGGSGSWNWDRTSFCSGDKSSSSACSPYQQDKAGIPASSWLEPQNAWLGYSWGWQDLNLDLMCLIGSAAIASWPFNSVVTKIPQLSIFQWSIKQLARCYCCLPEEGWKFISRGTTSWYTPWCTCLWLHCLTHLVCGLVLAPVPSCRGGYHAVQWVTSGVWKENS